jgi:hypothetical protein
MLAGNKIRHIVKWALACVLVAFIAWALYWYLLAPHSTHISWEIRNEDTKGNPNQPDALQILIRPSDDSSLEKLAINVAVTNISKEPIGWDSEFSCFLYWTVWNRDHGGFAAKQSPTPIEQTQEKRIKIGYCSSFTAKSSTLEQFAKIGDPFPVGTC